MRKTITIATFSFENPAHFTTGSQIIAMVIDCCEGLFGAEQLNADITYRIGRDPLCVGISLDRPEGQAMARAVGSAPSASSVVRKAPSRKPLLLRGPRAKREAPPPGARASNG